MVEPSDFPSHIVGEVLANALPDFARVGIWFGDAAVLETRGDRLRAIAFKHVYIDLENSNLQKALSEASSEWRKLLNALAIEKLVSDEEVWIYDYVDIFSVSWSIRRGPCVELRLLPDADELLQKYFLASADVQEMEAALRKVLRYQVRRILQRVNYALVKLNK